MTARNLLRHGGRVALPLGIAAAIAGLATGPVFAAAGNPTVTRGDGSDATAAATSSDTCLHIDGTVPQSVSGATTSLVIVDAQGNSHSVGSVKASATASKTLSFQFSTAGLSWSGGCGSGSKQALNGTYKAQLTGGVNASASFRLALPPATPSGFAADASDTVASFTWNPNQEPDLAGYDIVDETTNTDVTSGGVDAGSVCDASGCSVSVDFGSGAQGTTHTFHVVALRHTSPGSSGYLDSPASPSKSVAFPAAPTPSSTPPGGGSGGGSGGSGGSGGGSGGGGSGSGGSGSGGSTAGHGSGKSSHPVSGKHPAADLSASLPTYTAGSAPDLPSVLTEVKPLPQGTYKPQLPYGDQVTREAIRHKDTGVTATVAHDIAAVLDTG
jgi:hypothetical protein